MIAWRIVKRKYASADVLLSGRGAKIAGGRWNRRGLAVVYASSTSSLALLETLVHVDVADLPQSLVAVEIVLPKDQKPLEITQAQLPRDWREVGNETCVALGSEWIESLKSLALLVPSAVNPLEKNVLLNPAHHAIERCSVGEIVPITYDARLLPLFS